MKTKQAINLFVEETKVSHKSTSSEPEVEFIEVTPEIQKKMDKIAALLSDDDHITASSDVSTKKGKRSV